MPRRPNFILFITDQQRADYLGCHHPLLRTPNIDAIAAAGTLFENCHAASPACMPNRAALFTGRYPSVNGVRYNGIPLSSRAVTFADVLRRGGYRTALIGKCHLQPMLDRAADERVDAATLGAIDEAWHAPDAPEQYDQELPAQYASSERFAVRTPYYGFEHTDLVTGHGAQCGGHYAQWLREQGADALRARRLAHDYACPQAERTALPVELHPSCYIRDRAIEFIAGAREQPFLLVVSFPDPHHPFTPPGNYWSMYSPDDFAVPLPFAAHRNPPPPLRALREDFLAGAPPPTKESAFMVDERAAREAMALTCGMLSLVDHAIGGIVGALRDSGRDANSVILYTSDHGDYLGDFGMLMKGALQLRSITRVPLIWSEPRRRESGRSRAMVSTIDIAPSIIARAGLKPYWGIQGRNLPLPELEAAPARRALLVEFEDAVRRMGFARAAAVRSVLTERHRLSLYLGADWGELYDHAEDPGETFNLWDEPAQQSRRAALMETLAQLMAAARERSPRARRLA
ncbi:MAG: sulfatase-like hydrolase/transferase [Gammaproteobacteria bacterium]